MSANYERISEDRHDEQPKHSENKPDKPAKLEKLMQMVPPETWENILKYLPREQLDRCQRVCRRWCNIIQCAGTRLPQLRHVDMQFIQGDMKDVLVFTNNDGKELQIDIDFVRANPGVHVLKNSIIYKLHEVVREKSDLLGKYKAIYQLTGERIPVKNYSMELSSGMWNVEQWNKCRRAFTLFIDTPKIYVRMRPPFYLALMTRFHEHPNEDFFDFGPKVNLMLEADWRPTFMNDGVALQLWGIPIADIIRIPPENYHRFYGCQGFMRPHLIHLKVKISELYNDHFDWVVTSFLQSEDPKFFKSLILDFRPSNHEGETIDQLIRTVEAMPRRQKFMYVAKGSRKMKQHRGREYDATTTTYQLVHPGNKHALKIHKLLLTIKFELECYPPK